MVWNHSLVNGIYRIVTATLARRMHAEPTGKRLGLSK